jgi:hypothetical protein
VQQLEKVPANSWCKEQPLSLVRESRSWITN